MTHSPPKGLLSGAQWLFKHPLGWLVIDLVLLLSFAISALSLELAGEWYVPPVLTSLTLAVLIIGFIASFGALMFRWFDTRQQARVREGMNYLDQRNHERARWLLQRINETQPTQPIPPMRFRSPDPTEQSLPAQARKDRLAKNGAPSEDETLGFMRGILASLESTGEHPLVRGDGEAD